MKRIKKNLIQKAVIAPLSIGAVAAVLFFSMLPFVAAFFPLSKQEIAIADFEQGHQDIGFESSPGSGTLKKADILFGESNKSVGAVTVNGVNIPLVYDADGVSLTDALSLSPKGNYIGETGCAYAYGVKSVLSVNMFHSGQDIEVLTEYGSYVFTVVDIKTFSSEYSVYSADTGTKKGLVLYTNADNGYGISSSYKAVVMDMKSGPVVEE